MRLKSLLLSGVMLAAATVARADTINVFNLNASTSFGALSGTVTLNATTGNFTGSSIIFLYDGPTFPGFVNGATYSFTGAPVSSTKGTGFSSNDFLGTGDKTAFDFDLSLPMASLIGYKGGAICSVSLCSSASAFELYSSGQNYASVNSGTLTLMQPAVAVTPEPSALVLLATGVLGVGVVLRKRFSL